MKLIQNIKLKDGILLMIEIMDSMMEINQLK